MSTQEPEHASGLNYVLWGFDVLCRFRTRRFPNPHSIYGPACHAIEQTARNVSDQVINLELSRGGNHLLQPLAIIRSFSGIFASSLCFQKGKSWRTI